MTYRKTSQIHDHFLSYLIAIFLYTCVFDEVCRTYILLFFTTLHSFSAVNGVNDVITSPGNTAVFFCNASGDPALSYEWGLSQIGEFSSNTRLRISGIDTASLSISEVTLSDTCNNTEMVVCTISLFDKVVSTANGSFEVLRKFDTLILKNSITH